MILADENIHSFIIKALGEAGFSVNSINENSKGIKDEEVIKRAIENNYWLLTEDKDFGEWVFSHHVQNLSVIFLRYKFYEYQQIAFNLINLLQKNEIKKPAFVTLTVKKIRIRQL
jgi:predicted nuclease of predicted toxin-antitoxin system